MSIYRAPTAVRPSYKQGFARNASEAKYPQLWKGLWFAWHAALGHPGISKLKNWGDKFGDGTIADLTITANWYRVSFGPCCDADGDTNWRIVWDNSGGLVWKTTDSFTFICSTVHTNVGASRLHLDHLGSNRLYVFNWGNTVDLYVDGASRATTGVMTAGNPYLYWLRSSQGSMQQNVVNLWTGKEDGASTPYTLASDIDTHAGGVRFFSNWRDEFHCAYYWNRALSDSELILMRDSVAPFRRRSRPLIMPIAAAAAPAGLAAGQRAIMVS